MNAAKVITNDYRDFHLLALGQLLSHGEGHGPFVWVQDGCAPDDPRQRACSFVLTRRGTWLHYYLFLALPEAVRRKCAMFESSADALALASTLTGRPVVEDSLSLPELIHSAGYSPADSDAAGKALLLELQRRHPNASLPDAPAPG